MDMDTHFFSLFFSIILCVCQSLNQDPSKLVQSSLSNISESSELIVTRKRRNLIFPSRSLVFPDDTKIKIKYNLEIPFMNPLGDPTKFEGSFPLIFTLPNMRSLNIGKSLKLEKEHRGIFQAAEDFLTR